jgi:hypothetical protein
MAPENGFFQDWDSGYDTDGFVESKELAPSNQEGVHPWWGKKKSGYGLP